MKRFLLLIAVFAFMAAQAYADIQMSIGVGGYGELVLGDEVTVRSSKTIGVGPLSGITYKTTKSRTGREVDVMLYGVYVFFDITYAEATISFGKGLGKGYSPIDGSINSAFSNNNTSYTTLGISLLGKFPIEFDTFTMFPALGFDYTFVLSATNKGEGEYRGPPAEDLHQLGLLFGLGFDRGITERTYLRFMVLGHVRFTNSSAPQTASNDMGLRLNLGIGFLL